MELDELVRRCQAVSMEGPMIRKNREVMRVISKHQCIRSQVNRAEININVFSISHISYLIISSILSILSRGIQGNPIQTRSKHKAQQGTMGDGEGCSAAEGRAGQGAGQQDLHRIPIPFFWYDWTGLHTYSHCILVMTSTKTQKATAEIKER